MDLFTATTQILVVTLIGSTFAAMIGTSILDSIVDQKVLVARFRAATKKASKVIAR